MVLPSDCNKAQTICCAIVSLLMYIPSYIKQTSTTWVVASLMFGEWDKENYYYLPLLCKLRKRRLCTGESTYIAIQIHLQFNYVIV